MRFLKPQHRYILYHILAVVLVLVIGTVIMAKTYFYYDAIQKNEILQNASMIASGFDQHRILHLTGSEADFSSPDYLYLKDKLAKIRAANAGVRFVYLVGYRDGQPFFFADSEPDSSPDSSPPGQIYTEADTSFSTPFFTGKSIIDGIYPDRWGLFLTALAPIFDPQNPNVVIAEVGIDEDAINRSLNLLINSSPVMFPVIFFLVLIMINFILKKHDEDIKQLREDFSSMMVHELRSPLDNIKKITELLVKKKTFESDEEYLNFIFQDSSKMLELVNDLLDVAKLEAGKFQVYKQSLDITALLNERANFFKTSAQFSNVTIATCFDKQVPKKIELDPIRIDQVLNNLLSNAIKFTPAKGTVTIQALLHQKGQSIEEEAMASGIQWFINKNTKNIADAPNSLIVAVTDTGPGLSQNKIAQLFIKFKQFKVSAEAREKKGTGLGLVVVKGIIDAHHGKVGVVSQEGAGSSFYFILPV